MPPQHVEDVMDVKPKLEQLLNHPKYCEPLIFKSDSFTCQRQNRMSVFEVPVAAQEKDIEEEDGNVTSLTTHLLDHLKNRKIAPIVESSKEKDNIIALKIMCVFDYLLEKNQLYAEIEKTPKLLHQLLELKSYAKFHYWQYPAYSKFDKNYLLVCTICKVIGPYRLILSHMATTHNRHVSAMVCAWCNKTELKDHQTNKTLNACYEEYKTNNGIVDYDAKVFSKFHGLLYEFASLLGVCTIRNLNYNAKGKKKREYLIDTNYDTDGLSNETIHFMNYQKRSMVNEIQLNKYFKNAMEEIYGPKSKRFFVSCDYSNDSASTSASTSASASASTSTSASASASTSTSSTLPVKKKVKTDDKRFANMISSILSNIPEGPLKKRAKIGIQTLAVKYSNQAYNLIL